MWTSKRPNRAKLVVWFCQTFNLFPLRLPESLDKEDRPLYFQTADVAECLAGPGYNAERLSVPYVPQVTGTTGRSANQAELRSSDILLNTTRCRKSLCAARAPTRAAIHPTNRSRTVWSYRNFLPHVQQQRRSFRVKRRE